MCCDTCTGTFHAGRRSGKAENPVENFRGQHPAEDHSASSRSSCVDRAESLYARLCAADGGPRARPYRRRQHRYGWLPRAVPLRWARVARSFRRARPRRATPCLSRGTCCAATGQMPFLEFPGKARSRPRESHRAPSAPPLCCAGHTATEDTIVASQPSLHFDSLRPSVVCADSRPPSLVPDRAVTVTNDHRAVNLALVAQSPGRVRRPRSCAPSPTPPRVPPLARRTERAQHGARSPCHA